MGFGVIALHFIIIATISSDTHKYNIVTEPEEGEFRNYTTKPFCLSHEPDITHVCPSTRPMCRVSYIGKKVYISCSYPIPSVVGQGMFDRPFCQATLLRTWFQTIRNRHLGRFSQCLHQYFPAQDRSSFIRSMVLKSAFLATCQCLLVNSGQLVWCFLYKPIYWLLTLCQFCPGEFSRFYIFIVTNLTSTSCLFSSQPCESHLHSKFTKMSIGFSCYKQSNQW